MNRSAVLWSVGLGCAALSSCGGTVLLGDRSAEDAGAPISAGHAGSPSGGAGGSAGVGGTAGQSPIFMDGAVAGGGQAGTAGSGGVDASAPTGGAGGTASWQAAPNGAPPPGAAGAEAASITVDALATTAAGEFLVGGTYVGGQCDLSCLSSYQISGGFLVGYSSSGASDICSAATSQGAVDDINVDSAGDVVIAGWMGADTVVGSTTLTCNGEDDVVVAKYSADGAVQWAEAFGYEGVQQAHGVATDDSLNVYVAGEFEGTILSGSDVLIGVGSRSAFALKLDAAGNWIWGRSWGSGWAVAEDVATLPSGGAAIAGMFDGPADLGGSSYVSQGGRDGFLLALDADGQVSWSKTFGNAEQQYVSNLASDAQGHLAIVGRSSGALDLGGGANDPGAEAVFVAVFDSEGSYLWSKQLPVGPDDPVIASIPSVVFNAAGDVIVAGGFQGQVDFGEGPLSSQGRTDVFVAAWSSTGQPLWSRRYGDAGAQAARALSYRQGAGLTLAGTFTGTLDFGAGSLQAGPSWPSMFLVRFP